jgi:hypothetical protein
MTAIVVADSVTALNASHRGAVVVTGSHGGRIAAIYAAQAQVRGVAFNDAGRGLDDAGVAGLAALDAIGIAALAVAHTSARIGDGGDTLAHGVVSVVNRMASEQGVRTGMACADAAARLRDAPWRTGTVAPLAQARMPLLAATAGCAPVVGCDSIGLVEARDAGAVLVIGSHGGLHGGDPASALPVPARAAFFHDAGRGKDDAGVSRLPVLDRRGIPAAAVDHRTARIGDARSLFATGVLSVCNEAARARGVRAGTTVRDAAGMLRQLT